MWNDLRVAFFLVYKAITRGNKCTPHPGEDEEYITQVQQHDRSEHGLWLHPFLDGDPAEYN
jgi:hypothetical protein